MNKINLKKFMGVLTISGLLMTSLTACKKGPAGVVAQVNGNNITQEQFVKEYSIQRNYYLLTTGGTLEALDKTAPNAPTKSVDEIIQENILKNMITEELLKEEATKAGFKVDDAEIDKNIEEIKSQYGGEEGLNKALKEAGMTLDYYKESMKKNQLIGEFIEKSEQFKATDDEVKAYYDKHKSDYEVVKAAHILVETEEEAKNIKSELDKGSDFATIAKEKSKDTGSAENGGDLGEFDPSIMVPEFSEALKAMKVGEISQPVKSQYGYHIIRLDDKKEKTLDEVKDTISQQLASEKFQKYLTDLEKNAKIEKYLDPSKKVEVPKEYQLDGIDYNVKDPAKEENTQNAANGKENKNASEDGQKTENKDSQAENKKN